jgi:hypothetical protein
MKNLITTIQKIKPHHSFAITTDKVERNFILDFLKENLQNVLFIDIKKSFKQSLIQFLEQNGIKYPKSANTILLADKIAKYARKNGKHIVFSFEEFLDLKNSHTAQKALVTVYNVLTQNQLYGDNYKYYPIVVIDRFYVKDLIQTEGMWQYKPYFPKTDFKVKVGLWIEECQCWKCKKNTNVLVGIKINNKYFSITDLKEEFLDFLNKFFPEEKTKLNLKKGTDNFIGYFTNYCFQCNSKIGNYYINDDIYMEKAVFDFEDVNITQYKEIFYDEIKKIIEII